MHSFLFIIYNDIFQEEVDAAESKRHMYLFVMTPVWILMINTTFKCLWILLMLSKVLPGIYIQLTILYFIESSLLPCDGNKYSSASRLLGITPFPWDGNPLYSSCLENPVDRGAWWAADHRVAQSRTPLKRLSLHACIGEGNCNPLQYSCLENPTRGA